MELNILEYQDPLFTSFIIRDAIKQERKDVLEQIDLNNISYETFVTCKNKEILKILLPYIEVNEHMTDLLIINDNLEALEVFGINPLSRIKTIEESIPYNIITSLLDKLNKDIIFNKALLLNNYEIALLTINLIDKTKIFWRNVITTSDSRIVNLFLTRFGPPFNTTKEFIKSVISNGHVDLALIIYDSSYIFNPSILSYMISHNRYEDAMKIYNKYNFDICLDKNYYITNIEGYKFFKNILGFNVNDIILDIISYNQYDIIDKITDDYAVEPSLHYIMKALSGICHNTLFVTLNKLATIGQIRQSVSFSNGITITNKRCLLVYFRILRYLCIELPDLYLYALEFDCVEILKSISYDISEIMIDAILNNAYKIYKYTYNPDIKIDDDILSASYPTISSEFLHILINRYGVPEEYENNVGDIGTIKMIEEYKCKKLCRGS